MADSDNTTTLPFVTRRRKTQDFVAMDIRQDKPEPRNVPLASEPDPTVALAEIWRDAQARAMALCRRQQKLENRLARRRGHRPSPAPDDAAPSANFRHGALHLAYSRMKDAEARAAEQAELLLEELARTPARSIDGIIAKLEVVLIESETVDARSDFPWPQLRSLLADMRALIVPERPLHRQKRA